MNHIYRVVWSHARQAWVAVCEFARGRGKRSKGTRRLLATLALLPMQAWAVQPVERLPAIGHAPAAAPAAIPAVFPIAANANPVGGRIVSGAGSIDQIGATTTITQGSQVLSLAWDSFDIGADGKVTFLQPDALSIAVNRILGNDASTILGRLDANGQVFLINPNGVLFGEGAQVNVGGLVASTLDFDDHQLGSDTLRFSGNSGAVVVNRGTLTTANGGYIALLGHNVSNQGVISARLGTVALAGGNAIALNFEGAGLAGVQVEQSALNALVENRQLIVADGGQVLMTAGAKDSLLASVVNNTGVVQARAVENRDGRIILLGGMEAGTTNVAGTLDASAPTGGDGGFIETSAAQVKIADGATITTLAADGATGTWLIDPTDFTIAASGGDMSGATLSTNLGGGNVIIQSTSGGAGTAGDVNVNDTVSWSANTLTLNARKDININATMNAGGTAGLALEYGQSSPAAGNASSYHVNAPINLASTGSFSTKLGNDGTAVNYTILTSLGVEADATSTTLQGINNALSGNYVLGNDIDANATASWNSGAGFDPIGGSLTSFTGSFDGLGHTISGVTINRPTLDRVGLFGSTVDPVIRNIGLTGADITGKDLVGGLVGYKFGGSVGNSYVTGQVVGGLYAGGLVGANMGSISNSYATAAVSGNFGTGGLVGYSRGSIDNSYATGQVVGSDWYTGGLLGGNAGTGSVSNSYATGDVSGGNGGAGGLVGGSVDTSSISNSYATGDVSSNANDVGGLVGSSYASISNSYATGKVSGNTQDVGGLVGIQYAGSISQSYATGAVSGPNAGGSIGGLVGSQNAGTISDSYWATDTTNQGNSAGGGTGKTAAELIAALPAGFDPAIWGNQGSQTTPYLLDNLGSVFVAGDLTGVGTRLYAPVTTMSQLQDIDHDLGGSYALFDDLDGSNIFFSPIGRGSTFTGMFDGLGHIVNNLTVNLGFNGSFAGLFGNTSSTAVVRNIGLVNVDVTGLGHTGALVGDNAGTISNVYASGNVTGSYVRGSSGTTDYLGGLVGHNTGQLEHVHASVDVQGVLSNYVGGLVGGNEASGTITDAYATGMVIETEGGAVGGLVGGNAGGTLTNVHATGGVTGGYSFGYTGGLVGYNISGTITNAYATGAVSGSAAIGGLVGLNGGTITNAYAAGPVSGAYVSDTGGLVGTNTGTVVNGYWNLDRSGIATGMGSRLTGTGTVIGLSGADVFNSTKYAGFIFTTTPGAQGNAWVMVDTDGTLNNAGGVAGGAMPMLASEYSTYLLNSHQLQLVAMDTAADYTLGADIDASATGSSTGVSSGADVWGKGGFVPIGSGSGFSGAFDGQGHTIDQLVIRSGLASTGLFQSVASTGSVANLGLMGGSVTGTATNAVVGGLAGSNRGALAGVFTTGTVTGSDAATVGGLVGHNDTGGTITDAYASGPVTGDQSAGGLVGDNSGAITNAYALGMVSGNGDAGGLVGHDDAGGTVANGYWDTETSGQATSAGGTGMTTAQLIAALPTGFGTSIWDNANNQTTPYLMFNPGSVWVAGQGTTWFSLILSMAQLRAIDANLAGHYALINNLDASGVSGFTPIGNPATPFTGIFDGLGHTISNLTIDVSGDYVGLFGATSTAAVIRNVGLVNADITGRNNVGGLVGLNNGTIRNAYVGGNVMGTYDTSGPTLSIGGLVGYNYGRLDYVHASVDVRASADVQESSGFGGLVGINDGVITSAYATGAVSGDYSVGGLVGVNINTILGAYATGAVTAVHGPVGGLVGINGAVNYATITAAYATGAVSSAGFNVGGLVGMNISDSTITSVYSTGAVSGSSYAVGLVSILYGTLYNGYWNTDRSGNTVGVLGWDASIPTSLPRSLSGAGVFDSTRYGGFTFTTTPGAQGNAWVMVDADGTLNGSNGASMPMLAFEYSTNITNAHQLQLMAMDPSADYTLGADIDASATGSSTSATTGSDVWGSGGFAPVGNGSNAFTGTFDGRGHTISNLTINRPGNDNVGLFGVTGVDSAIRNLGLLGASITGQDYVGGLAGTNGGTISQVFATGTVGGSSNVGGLVGNNGGTISQAYATAAVSGIGSNVGGLAGSNFGTINQVYAIGAVSSTGNDVGGLVGLDNGTITDGYWDTETTGQANSSGGTGLTTAQMMDPASFAAWGADLSAVGGSNAAWRIYAGHTTPLLRAFMTSLEVSLNDATKVYDSEAFAGSTDFDYGALVPTRQLPAATVDGSLVEGQVVTAVAAEDVGTYALVADLWSGQLGYDIEVTGSASLSITQKAITVDATASDKVYDATTAATATAASAGVFAGDTVDFAVGDATFGDKNAGTGKTVTATGITASGADAGNYSFNASATGTADISQLAITVDATAGNKVYDATTAATAIASSAGVIAGDSVDFAIGAAAFADKNAGTGKAVTVTGISASGADAGNYSFSSSATSSANISQRAITVDATASDKVYDGTTAATATAASTGVIAGDSVDFAVGDATFAGKNAGTGKTVTATGITASGVDAGNYALQNTSDTDTANISQLAITVDVTASDKIYDATTAATITGLSGSGVIAGDDLTFAGGTGSFDDKNAGTDKTVTVTGVTASGADAGNYSFGTSATGTADISQRAITVDATASDKIYDGTTAATITGLSSSGILVGDDLAFASGSGSFDDKNAGTGKTVTITGISASGADAGNYTVDTTTSITTADITPLAITVDATASDKVYDATTAAAATAASAGVIAGDSVDFAVGDATFADKNAGTGKAVTATGITASGTDAGNYTLQNTSATDTADISQRAITVTATASDKVYDATTAATITALSSSGIVAGDDLVFAGGTGSFADKNAGTGKTVTATGITASGVDAGNYSFSNSATGTADISRLAITIDGTASDKVYDGTTAATITGLSSSGILAGDDLVFAGGTGTFDDKNAGADKTVTITGVAASGNDAGNYSFNANATGTADISQRAITVDATASDKVYDATTVATATAASTDVIAGDSVSFAVGGAMFDDKNAGTGKTVTVTGITSNGADAGNYSFNTNATDTADITPATLTYVADQASRFVGQAASALTGTVDGLVGGDTLDEATDGSLAWTTPATTDSPAGNYAIDGSGLSASNYVFTQAAGNANALAVVLGRPALQVTSIVAALQHPLLDDDEAHGGNDGYLEMPTIDIVGDGVRLP